MTSEHEDEDKSGSGAVSSESNRSVESGDDNGGSESKQAIGKSENGSKIVDGDVVVVESDANILTAAVVPMEASRQQPVPKNEMMDSEKNEYIPGDKEINLDSDDVEKAKSTLPPNPSHEQEKPQQPKKEHDHKQLVVAMAVPFESEEFFDGDKKADVKQVAIPTAAFDPDEDKNVSFCRRYAVIIGGCCALGIALIVLLAVLLRPQKTQVGTPSPSEAPSFSPTVKTRETIIMNMLAQVFSPNVLVEGTSYSRAVDWILNEDQINLAGEPDEVLKKLVQRFGLAVFYFSTTRNGLWRSCNAPYPVENNITCTFLEPTRASDGISIEYTEVPNRVRWLSNTNECEWQGLTCDRQGMVVAIDVGGQRIQGNLARLLAADVEQEENGLVSNILTKVFPRLLVLHLDRNELSGTLPLSIAEFSDLLLLELHDNSLTGEIPISYFDQLTSLQLLNLGGNQLSGTLNTRIGQLTELRGLHLYQNNFRGQFPSEIGKLSSFLTDAYMGGNEFSGQLPTEIGLLTSLSILDYADNLFTETIPSELGQLTNMDQIQLEGNLLSGKIPVELCNLTNARLIALEKNLLTGALPTTELLQLQRLQLFTVDNNELTGPIPNQLGNLPSLLLAWLHLNQFTGAVPNELCEARSTGLSFLQADCSPIDNPPNPCRCCTACCDRAFPELCLETI